MSTYADDTWEWVAQPLRDLRERCRAEPEVSWDERFDRFLPVTALDDWERAVAHLVTAVGDRTQYESAWYGCCRTVLGWFLEAAGIAAARREELLEHAIAGRFNSWVEPPRAVRESVAEDLARRVARDHA